jgi:EVE domain
MACWVGVASRAHVMRAIEGGFAQVNHGKAAPLKRIKRGDHMLYYSPRLEMRAGDPVKAFTAIGLIEDDEPHRDEQVEGFYPYRRKVRYFKAHDAPIKPLLDKLEMTHGKSSWGILFRRGLFRISDGDYRIIARAMGIPQRN